MGGFLPCLTRGQSSVRMNIMVVSSSLEKKRARPGQTTLADNTPLPPKKGGDCQVLPAMEQIEPPTNKLYCIKMILCEWWQIIKLLPTGFQVPCKILQMCLNNVCTPKQQVYGLQLSTYQGVLQSATTNNRLPSDIRAACSDANITFNASGPGVTGTSLG